MSTDVSTQRTLPIAAEHYAFDILLTVNIRTDPGGGGGHYMEFIRKHVVKVGHEHRPQTVHLVPLGFILYLYLGNMQQV